MSRQIKILQAELRTKNASYGALFTPIPRESWPSGFEAMTPQPELVARNRGYLVQVFPEVDGAQRLSICRTMIANNGRWEDGMTWDELMSIKNQIGYEDRWAVEIYPPASKVVNVANMRHIWLLKEKPVFAW